MASALKIYGIFPINFHIFPQSPCKKKKNKAHKYLLDMSLTSRRDGRSGDVNGDVPAESKMEKGSGPRWALRRTII